MTTAKIHDGTVMCFYDDTASLKVQSVAVRAARLRLPFMHLQLLCVCVFFFLSYANNSVEIEGRSVKRQTSSKLNERCKLKITCVMTG